MVLMFGKSLQIVVIGDLQLSPFTLYPLIRPPIATLKQTITHY